MFKMKKENQVEYCLPGTELNASPNISLTHLFKVFGICCMLDNYTEFLKGRYDPFPFRVHRLIGMSYQTII